MAKHDQNTPTSPNAPRPETENEQGQPWVGGAEADRQTEQELEQSADRGGLRQRTEQDLRETRARQDAEAYAPPAGQGTVVNPDAQRQDPDGEAKPTA